VQNFTEPARQLRVEMDAAIAKARGARQQATMLRLALDIERFSFDAQAELRERAEQRSDAQERRVSTLLQHIARLEELVRSLGVELPSIVLDGELTRH
jgi:hypothetical protein